ncbi:unnamed protein product [Acanthosepion pharaonis]|uniref:Uncharacterized protein n=1 Tax=Acanthosepion pharaonis TaxID=158019 RepID=A0A812BLB5_ACAPH|nr:unnamed protein product [Sepia pharaonis]
MSGRVVTTALFTGGGKGWYFPCWDSTISAPSFSFLFLFPLFNLSRLNELLADFERTGPNIRRLALIDQMAHHCFKQIFLLSRSFLLVLYRSYSRRTEIKKTFLFYLNLLTKKSRRNHFFLLRKSTITCINSSFASFLFFSFPLFFFFLFTKSSLLLSDLLSPAFFSFLFSLLSFSPIIPSYTPLSLFLYSQCFFSSHPCFSSFVLTFPFSNSPDAPSLSFFFLSFLLTSNFSDGPGSFRVVSLPLEYQALNIESGLFFSKFFFFISFQALFLLSLLLSWISSFLLFIKG